MKKLLPTSTKLCVNKTSKGFTLIELLVVITIIAILSVIGIVAFSGVQRSARDAKRKADVKAIATALEAQKPLTSSTYPSSIPDSLFAGGVRPKDPAGTDYTISSDSATIPTKFCVCNTTPLENGGGNATGVGNNGVCAFASSGTLNYYCNANQQ